MNGAPVLALVVAAVLVLVYGALLSACEAALTRMTPRRHNPADEILRDRTSTVTAVAKSRI